MKKTLALLAFAIISIGSISAQSMQDVVYLKNGSIIRGMVIEIVSDGNVKVQTADGCVFVYPMTDVQKIQKEQNQALPRYNKYPYHPYSSKECHDELYGWGNAPRFRGFVELNNTFGTSASWRNRFGMLASFGYQVFPYLYVGAGTGFDYWTDYSYWSVPIFAHLRTEVHKAHRRNVSPFIDTKIGYNFVNWQGLYFTPSVGCHFYVGHSNIGLSAYIGFAIQRIDYDSCRDLRIGASLDF